MSDKQILEKRNLKSSSVIDTKIYSVLSQFNVYELNRLKKFVDSPYFNQNQGLSLMLKTLDTVIRSKSGESLTKAKLLQVATNQTKYNDLKFRKICSDLLKLTEEFLMQEMYEQNSLQRADNLLIAAYNRKIEALYNSALSRATRLSEKYYFRPATYYYYEYSFERNYYNLSGLEFARSKQANIDQMAANLDKFYVAEKLRSYITMLDRQKMTTHDYQLLFMDEIFEHVEKGNLKTVVPINLYYQIYLTRKEPDRVEHFEILKTMMISSLSRLPQLEAFEILDSALNYCISRINQGDTLFLREYMDLSVMGIKKEVLLVNGILSPWIFRNIVVTGLRLGDYDWVKNFILSYQHQIDDQYRDNAVSFNLANLYFYQKKYGNVLELLQSVEYDDPSYNRNSKIMLLLTYYEINEFESLSSLLSSFDLYLRRNKSIPENRKTPYYNLLKFLRTLVKVSDTDQSALKRLRIKVSQTESVVNKEWLLEKIDDLLK